MDNLKTGDILLFSGHTTGAMQYFSDMIKYGTHSNYSHVAMVLKDPTYFNLSLKGIYLWESGWEGKPDPQDNKIKLGVQLTPLNEIMENFKGSKIIVRPISSNKHFTDEKLKEIHEVVYNKPYDIVPKDWIGALFRKDSDPQKTNRFWCSALVGYIYTKCGIINPDTDWSILRPSDFSLDGERLSFINGYSLSKTETLIN
tara:strand:+ start:458 stop:1057 length:600 start_codon:yes stop_codon:yes gene_type:complete